jgi:hypothetical protein
MKLFSKLCSLFFLFVSAAAVAQPTQPALRHKIAIFAPLYLDSVFDATQTYRFGNAFPRFSNPGLEFYQGAQMALDSLKKTGALLDVYVYDSRSAQNPLPQLLKNAELKDAELLIAHATQSDVRILAEAAQQRKIPFISASLPNDAGVTNNPYMVILNATLRTHCEGIYRYLQRYHPTEKIIVFQKSGVQEDELREYLQEVARNTAALPLKMEFKNIGTAFDYATLAKSLDSTRNTVCMAGSLDENFGLNLAQNLAALRTTYPVTIVGMPTWDATSVAKEFTKPDYKDIEVVYSTPFYYDRPNPLTARLATEFESETNGRPSDMFYRGYETTLRFAQLLLDTGKDMASNLTHKGNNVFTAFDIEPVFLNKKTMTLDYFENKKLYYVRILNGVKTVL